MIVWRQVPVYVLHDFTLKDPSEFAGVKKSEFTTAQKFNVYHMFPSYTVKGFLLLHKLRSMPCELG